MNTGWVPHDTRDQIVDTVRYYAQLSGLPAKQLVSWIGIAKSKFYDWQQRYGRVNEHNALIPRDHWLDDWEKEAIINFYLDHASEGYRRVTFMMLDQDIVAVSPATTWRVLKRAGLLNRWVGKASKKGQGFQQPLTAHEHWHIDIAYLNICGTFFFLISVLDGYSRYLIHWDLRTRMTETDVEIILQKAHEKHAAARPRIISDNGPQFLAKDFKQFIRLHGMTHVRTSPYYPQSNGKLERYHQTIKRECIRRKTPLSLEEARRIIRIYIDYYNKERLHSAIGFIAPKDKLEGRENEIFRERDRKLEAAREQRKRLRQTAAANLTITRQEVSLNSIGETETSSAGKQLVRDNRSGFRRNENGGLS